MGKIGVSVYPSRSDFEEDQRYLELARKYGFTRVFTSLLEITGDAHEVVQKFKRIIEFGNSLGMETFLDINPALFKQLGTGYDDLGFFKELGATGIRLDLGFSGLEEALMTKNPYGLIIEVNMSSGTDYIKNIFSYHPNKEKLSASHNFYPQKYTGLSREHFDRTTALFNELNIQTSAFVTSQEGRLGPWPVQAGLCTLEEHRNLPIATQVLHYRLMGTIDHLIIGNAYASEEELKAMSEAYFSLHPTLKIELYEGLTDEEKKIVFDEVHIYRGDRSEYMIRSTSPRVKYKDANISPRHTVPIKRGDLLICNDDFGQYKGELQIALKDMENDGDRNVVGRLTVDCLHILDDLKPWSTFKLSL